MTTQGQGNSLIFVQGHSDLNFHSSFPTKKKNKKKKKTKKKKNKQKQKQKKQTKKH